MIVISIKISKNVHNNNQIKFNIKIMKVLLGIAIGFIACILWIYYRWTKD
jgi:hypothetical protein